MRIFATLERTRLSVLAGAAGLAIAAAFAGCGLVGVCHAASVPQPPDDQVVGVYAKQDDHSLRLLGSGVVVSRAGHIVTAAHIIDAASRNHLIVICGGSLSRAEVAAADAKANLALIIAAPAVCQPARLSDAPGTAPDQTVYAVGVSACRLGPTNGHVPWFFAKILGSMRSKPEWTMIDQTSSLAGAGLFAASDRRLVGLTVGNAWMSNGKERRQLGTAVKTETLRRFLTDQKVPGYAGR